MKTSDFYYELPKELIAQTPVEPRDSSRLLVLDRRDGSVEHRHFYDIIDYLREGDLIVANDSRVLPARIFGVKDGTGARVEFLLLKQISGNRWETLCKPGKKAREGASFTFGDGLLRAKVAEVRDDGNRVVESGKCRCRPISPPNCRTRSAIRPFTATNWVPPPRRPPDCILPRS